MKKTLAVLLLICMLLSSCAFADSEGETPYEGHDWTYISSYSTTLFVTVKNSSDEPVSVNGRCTASDEEGNVLSTATMNIRVIGPGEESVGVFRFEGITEKAQLNYELSYGPVTGVMPVLSELSVEPYPNEEGVTVLVTNRARVSAVSPVLYCLFFDENDELLSYAYSYLTDFDEELKPGVTMAEQMNSAGAFDHYRLYLSAYAREGAYLPKSYRVKEEDFLFTEYAEITPLDTTYYVAVQSNAVIPVGIRANAIAYDAEENVLGAANALIDVLAPGEEAQVAFTFYYVIGCDHIAYRLFFNETPSVLSAISDMSTEISFEEEDIFLTVTNTSDKPIRSAYATVLFADAERAVVASQMFSCADNEGELKPGASLTKKITSEADFEAIEVYVSGQKDF